MKKSSKFKEQLEKYEKSQNEKKEKIRQEKNGFKRFWKWVLFLLITPFKYIWTECHDWHFLLIFIIVVLVIGSEVWIPLLLAFVFWNLESFRITCLSIAGTCELFWMLPGTPFIPLCIVITISIKAIIEKIQKKKISKEIKEGEQNE